jgi:hypothetical protein
MVGDVRYQQRLEPGGRTMGKRQIDAIAMLLAGELDRRRLAGRLAAALLGGVLPTKRAGGSCKKVGQNCDQNGDCCDGAGCKGGECKCKDDRDECGGKCYKLDTDENRCGDCNTACAAGETCCDGTCVDALTDAANCGACGFACAGTATCHDGACRGSASCVFVSE